MIRVRPARPDDAAALAPRLRAADLQEIHAVTLQTPHEVLLGGIACSDPCHTVVDDDDRPLAVFGVVPGQDAGTGVIWLLGSDELVSRPRTFLKSSRAWIGTLLERYHTLSNVIDARNEVHVRWLRWCGFEIGRTIENHGVERRPFHEFARTSAR